MTQRNFSLFNNVPHTDEDNWTSVQSVIELLRQSIEGTEFENKTYICGGMVRDFILKRKSKDIDLMVDTPDGGIALAEFITTKFDLRKPVIFPKFGTAQFVLNEQEIEAVMPRTESYTEGSRKPDVEQCSLVEDCERRDLTINALLQNVSTGEILDPTGHGLEDIKNGRLRTPIDPEIIFRDDPLRMLRVIRFASTLGFYVSSDLLEAIGREAHRIESISKERINAELSKILTSKDVREGFLLLRVTGLLKIILPELGRLHGLAQNKYHAYDVLEHTLRTIENTPNDLITRLGALFHDVGKFDTMALRTEGEVGFSFHKHESVGAELTVNILKRLKFSNEIIDEVAVLVSEHMRFKYLRGGKMPTKKTLRKLKRDVGDFLPRLLDVMHGDNLSHGTEFDDTVQIVNIRELLKDLKEEVNSDLKLPLTGDDVMDTFRLEQGKEVGRLLALVREAVLDNPSLTKEEALDLIRENK